MLVRELVLVSVSIHETWPWLLISVPLWPPSLAIGLSASDIAMRMDLLQNQV